MATIIAGGGIGAYVGIRFLRAQAHFREAEKALASEDFVAASTALGRYLELWPLDQPTRSRPAQPARRAGAYDEADRLLKICSQIKWPVEAIQLEKSLARAQRGDLAQVENGLFKYISPEFEDAPLVLEALIQGYMQSFRLNQALRCSEILLERQPNNIRAIIWHAQVQERMRNVPVAVEFFRRAVELDPNQDGARLRLAELLVTGTQCEEALPHLEYLHARLPDHALVLFGLAVSHRSLGNIPRAVRYLDLLLEKAPNHIKGLAERAKIAREQGDFAGAEKWARKALMHAPYNRDANYTLSLCLAQRGQHAEAAACRERLTRAENDIRRIDQLEKQVVQTPRDPAIRFELGKTLLESGWVDEGLSWLQSALKEDPQYRPARDCLAEYFERIGLKQDAARHGASGGQAGAAEKSPR